eukprot:7545907-Pyramimonas_sp.AAC.1
MPLPFLPRPTCCARHGAGGRSDGLHWAYLSSPDAATAAARAGAPRDPSRRQPIRFTAPRPEE